MLVLWFGNKLNNNIKDYPSRFYKMCQTLSINTPILSNVPFLGCFQLINPPYAHNSREIFYLCILYKYPTA